ncbi:nuclear RNA export factor 1-like [Tribolium madens]|uniref:nuclear RNA export factor 1-like n=1 Tax=Tribolium madens TaxID=41895 RepID=UPI001CF75A4A|nr:nuclear RNA export factor 1-like [Tribolium madens]
MASTLFFGGESQSITNLDAKKIRQNVQAIIVNDFSLQTGILYKNKEVLENPIYWHKFIVNNAEDFSRDLILKTILDHVQPLDLIPVFFLKEGSSASFLARNCGAAIEKICKDNLIIDNPYVKNQPFKLSIILRYSTTNDVKIDVSKNISKVLRKRTNTATSTINLENFYQDSDLSEFCILSQPKLMSYVLHLSRLSKPKSIILSNNEIRSLVPIEALWGINVTSLDLRNNLIMSLTELEPLTQLKITELWLEGNPLCDNYDEHTYIQRVKEYCPKIERLDGVLLKHNGFPSFRRNFLCNSSGHDLVDQFLEYYFTSYDSSNRAMLKNLYHKGALFSLTADYHPMQLSSPSAQLKRYKTYSRNVLSLADLSRSDLNLQQGSKAIIDLLNLLPPSEHDPYSFTVDLIHYSDVCAIVVVTGVFKELPESILDAERFMGFNRCFALESINGEYCIINEQMHVFNALTSQQVKAFKHERPIRPQMLPPAQTPKQKSQIITAMKLITNLTTEWAKKCLEECHYDLKNALALFVDLYKVDKIPADGFQN